MENWAYTLQIWIFNEKRTMCLSCRLRMTVKYILMEYIIIKKTKRKKKNIRQLTPGIRIARNN